MFQFPSNGKAHPNLRFNSLQTGKQSKPERFQFPSNGKAHPNSWQRQMAESVQAPGFNSLQTGKHIQTVPCMRLMASLGTVSIPFKRESTSKLVTNEVGSVDLCKVSIPFKRESTSKLSSCVCNVCNGNEFQFPSNGKAHPNTRHWLH